MSLSSITERSLSFEEIHQVTHSKLFHSLQKHLQIPSELGNKNLPCSHSTPPSSPSSHLPSQKPTSRAAYQAKPLPTAAQASSGTCPVLAKSAPSSTAVAAPVPPSQRNPVVRCIRARPHTHHPTSRVMAARAQQGR